MLPQTELYIKLFTDTFMPSVDLSFSPPPSDEVDCWDDDTLIPQMSFYQLNLPLDDVCMVDTLDDLHACEMHLVQVEILCS